MARVTLTDVSKTYRGDSSSAITALDRVNLQIEDRDFVVLAGSLGSGKSTTLRLIAGLEAISRGEVYIGERPVNHVPPENREVAMVFANDSLYPQMTAYENIAFGLRRRRFAKTEIRRRVKDVASVFGVEQLLERNPNGLSLEQRQRVALARAVARQPKVFLFDEPLIELDSISRAELRTQIAKLHERLQTTMIYATGDSLEAMTMADQIVVLNKGAVEQTGTPRALYDKPVNLFVARFLGNPPMNLVQGELKQEHNSLVFGEASEGTIELRVAATEHPGAREFIGKQILLGIRPEDIELAQFASWNEETTANFPAIVDRIEPLGAETSLHLQTGVHALICRSHRLLDRREAGQRMQFKMNLRRLQLFDPVSTKRVV